jgi:hypothetical protein
VAEQEIRDCVERVPVEEVIESHCGAIVVAGEKR